MSETETAKPRKPKYDPTKDGPRMAKYMAEKRAKDRAGFTHLTVRQYRLIAPKAPE